MSHYFQDPRRFLQKMIAENALVEWNEVHGHFYGTPKKFVEDTLAEGLPSSSTWMFRKD